LLRSFWVISVLPWWVTSPSMAFLVVDLLLQVSRQTICAWHFLQGCWDGYTAETWLSEPRWWE
jgi:hypothetical protein